jgi:hypothetical protein
LAQAMIGPSALVKPVTAVAAVGLLVVFLSQGEHAAPSSASVVRPRLGLDATSDAEARRMREATHRLAGELRTASECDPRRSWDVFQACVSPGLQHTGVGGRGASLILDNLARRVPSGRCLRYVLGLSAANAAAGDNTRWLFANIYDYRAADRHVDLTKQIRLAYLMLRRSARAAAPDVCSPAGGMPPV